MGLKAPRAWLISYDIANPRRLRRLHRFLVRRALPVQYSVFYYEGSPAAMGRLMQQIEDLINPKQDDVRGYQLPEKLNVTTLGRGSIPGSTMVLSELGAGLQKLLASPSGS